MQKKPSSAIVRRTFLAVCLGLAALADQGRAIELESSSFGSGTFLLNDSVPYRVVLRGTVPTTNVTAPVTEGPFGYIVYAEGRDIYGNLVRIEVARGQARGLRGQVIDQSGANPVVVEEATTFTIEGGWTIPNDGTLFNIEEGYRLIVAVFRNPFTPSPPNPPLDPNNGPLPNTFAEFEDQRELTADGGSNIKIDVTPDLAIGRAIGSPGVVYQSGQYRGKDVITMTTSWHNENRRQEGGRESRPLRRNYTVDYYSATLRLTTDPQLGGNTSDDFQFYSVGNLAGDLAYIAPTGTSQIRKIEVTGTPPAVRPYGIRQDTRITPPPMIAETLRIYQPQAGDGFLDLGESVAMTTQELIPENYTGRYFVAAEVQASLVGENQRLDVNTRNNVFVSNDDSKIEILSTASPTIEPASAVSTQEGVYVEQGFVEPSLAFTPGKGNGASDFGSVSEDGSVVAFVSRASNLLTPPDRGSPTVPTTGQQVFLKLTQSREIELISGPRIGQVSANADCFNPEISANGRFVTYQSAASNILDEVPTAGRSMIYVFDRNTRQTVIISRNARGELANGDSFNPSISGTGRFVAFESKASNLDPAVVRAEVRTTGANAGKIAFFEVLRAGAGYRPGSSPAVTIHNVDEDNRPTQGSGAAAAATVGPNGGIDEVNPTRTGSGYNPAKPPLVTIAPPDQLFPARSALGQVYLHDRDTDGDGVFDEPGATATYLVSAQVLAGGSLAIGDNLSYGPAVNLDDSNDQIAANGGVYVVFASYASNLPDATGYAMVYRARVNVTAANTNARGLAHVESVSLNDAGETPTLTAAEWAEGFRPDSYEPSVNGDGRQVAFTSWGSNLVYNASTGAFDADTNEVQDVFVRDFDTPVPSTKRISISQERVATGVLEFVAAPWLSLPMPGGTPSGNMPVNQPVAGDRFEISDGLNSFRFVFDPAGGPAAGDIAVAIGANVFETRRNLLVAINSSGLRIEAFETTPPSENPPGTGYTAALYLRNTVPGQAGNVPIKFVSANGVLRAAGMAGGGIQAEEDALTPGNDDPPPIQGVPFGSSQPSIDRSGRFVAFRTIATNLDVHTRTEANNYAGSPITGELIRPLIWPAGNVYVHDRLADGDPLAPFDLPGNYTTQRVSVNKFGYRTYTTGEQEAGVDAETAANNNSPAISAGGRFVAFSSDSEGIGGLIFGNNNLQFLDNARFRDVFVVDRRINTDDPPAPSTKPVVILNSPGNGLRVQPGTTISVNASATASAGKQIASVRLFINGSPFGPVLTSEPYSWTYTLPSEGDYSLRVVAADSKGISSSKSVLITAAAPTGLPPVLSVDTGSQSNLVIGSDVLLNVTATDDGGVQSDRVNFFLNGAPLVATPQYDNVYTASFKASTFGAVSITASATDDSNNTSITQPQAFSFAQAGRRLPQVTMLPLDPGSATLAGGRVLIRAEATLFGAELAASRVEFYANGVFLGLSPIGPDGVAQFEWRVPPTPRAYEVRARVVAPNREVEVPTGELDQEGNPIFIKTTFSAAVLSTNFLTANSLQGVAPTVRIIQPTDGATAQLNVPITLRAGVETTPGVARITVSQQGSGYQAPAVSITGGGGAGAKAVLVIGAGGQVESVRVTDQGSGYRQAPVVSFSGGTGAAATAVVSNGRVTDIKIDKRGANFLRVALTGGGGTGAQAVPVVSAGKITGVLVTDSGTGYTSAPKVTFLGAAGSGAVANAVLVQPTVGSVQFYVNGQAINASGAPGRAPLLASPYQAVFTPTSQGTYQISAVATSREGLVSEPATSLVTVQTGAAPTVQLLSPQTSDATKGPFYQSGGAISIAADASAVTPGARVLSVEFFVDGQSVGVDSVAPYTASYLLPGPGTYTVTAVATDSSGNVGAGDKAKQPARAVVRAKQAPAGSQLFVEINYPAVPASFPLDVAPGSRFFINARAQDSVTAPRVKGIRFLANGEVVLGGVTTRGPSAASPFFSANYLYQHNTAQQTSVVAEVSTVVGGETYLTYSEPIVIGTESFLSYQPPTIELEPVLLPAGGARVGSPVTLRAEVVPGTPGTRVGQVDFFANGFFVGRYVNSVVGPFTAQVEFRPVATGNLKIRAAARSVEGVSFADLDNYVVLSTESASFAVTQPGRAPTVAFVTPADGARIAANSPLVVQVDPKVLDNKQIQNVQFFINGNLASTITSPPYAFTANLPGEGAYRIAATVTDSGNLRATAQRNVTVVSSSLAGTLPTVSQALPPAGGLLTAGSQVYLNFNVFDPSKSATVRIFANGAQLPATRIGPTGTTWSALWNPQTVGSYAVYAVVTDAKGNVASTGNRTFNVVAQQPNRPEILIDNYQLTSQYLEVGVPVILRARAKFGANTEPVVEFYANGVLVGTGTAGGVVNGYTDYTCEWIPDVAGKGVTITARAVGQNYALSVPGTGGGSTGGASNQSVPVFASSINSNSPSRPVTGLTINAVDATTASGRFVVEAYRKLLYGDPFYSEWKWYVDKLNQNAANRATGMDRADVIMQLMGFSGGSFNQSSEYALSSAVAFSPYGRLGLTPTRNAILNFLEALRADEESGIVPPRPLPISGTYSGVPNAPYGATLNMATAMQGVLSSGAFRSGYPQASGLGNSDYVVRFLRDVMFRGRFIGLDAIPRIVPMMDAYTPQRERQGAAAAFLTKYMSAVMSDSTLNLTPEGVSTRNAERAFQLKLNTAALGFQWNGVWPSKFDAVPDYSKSVVWSIIDPRYVPPKADQQLIINVPEFVDFVPGARLAVDVRSTQGARIDKLSSSRPDRLAVSGLNATMRSPGRVAITAQSSGNSSVKAASATKNVEIVSGRRTQTISGFSPPKNRGTGSTALFRLSAKASSGLPVRFVSSDPSVIRIEGTSARALKRGTATISAQQGGNRSFKPTTVSRPVKVW